MGHLSIGQKCLLAWLLSWSHIGSALDVWSANPVPTTINGKTGSMQRLQIKVDEGDVGVEGGDKSIKVVSQRAGETAQVYSLQISAQRPKFLFRRTLAGYSPTWAYLFRTIVQLSPWAHQDNDTDTVVIKEMKPKIQGGELLQAGQPQLVIGSGIGFAVDLACVIPIGIFGNCGKGGIDAVMGSVINQLDIITKTLGDMANWQGETTQKFVEYDQWIKVQQEESDRQRQSIDFLKKNVQTAWDFTMKLTEFTQSGFKVITSELEHQAKLYTGLGETVSKLASATQNNSRELSAQIISLSQTVQNVLTTMWQIYQDTGVHRELVRRYYEYEESLLLPRSAYPDYQPLDAGRTPHPLWKQLGLERNTRFLNVSSGVKPKPAIATRKIDDAVPTATTYVQWTQSEQKIPGGPLIPFAQSVTIEYLCDKEFFINNAVPELDLRTLFARLGPDNCNVAAWTCRCVIRWIRTRCETLEPNIGIFPFTSTPVTAANDRRICQSGGQETQRFVMTSEYQFRTELQRTFCAIGPRVNTRTFTPAVPDKLHDQPPYSFLVIANDMRKQRWVPTALSAAGDEASCENTFYVTDEKSNFLAQTIYQIWSQSYAIMSRTALPATELEIHGGLPNQGMKITETAFARDPATGYSMRRLSADLTSIASVKEPWYTNTLILRQSGVTVKVYEERAVQGGLLRANEPDEIYELGLGQESKAWPGFEGDFNMTTDVTAVIVGLEALPAFFVQAGLLDSRRDRMPLPPREIHKTTGEPYQPDSPYGYTFDFQQSQFNIGQQRCGYLNYLFEGAHWENPVPTEYSGPLSFEQWTKYNRDPFDPTCVESLLPYLRIVERQDTGQMDRCIGSFPQGYETFDKFSICQLAENFIFTQTRDDELVLEARKFQILASVWIPVGTVLRSLSSYCPSLRVQRAADNTTISFSSDSPEDSTVRIQIKQYSTEEYPGYKPDPGCNVCNENIERQLRFKVPYTIKLGRDIQCPSHCRMQMNVFTLDGQTCYEPWINVTNEAEVSGPMDFGDQYRKIITEGFDNVGKQIGQGVIRAVEVEYAIADINRRSGATYDEIKERVAEILRNQTRDFARQIGINDIDGYIKAANATITENSAHIAENVDKGNKASRAQWELIEQMTNRTNTLIEYMEVIRDDINKTQEAARQTHIAWDEFKNSQSMWQSCGIPIPLIGNAICGVANLFNGVFDLFGGTTLKSIISWIIFLIILCCLGACVAFCCVKCCPSVLNSCIKSCTTVTPMQEANAQVANSRPPLPFGSTQLPMMTMEDIMACLDAMNRLGIKPRADFSRKWEESLRQFQTSSKVGTSGRGSEEELKSLVQAAPAASRFSSSSYGQEKRIV